MCQHDGVPDSACAKCVNCSITWTGNLCELPKTCRYVACDVRCMMNSDRCASGDASAVCTCLNGGTVDQTSCTCQCLTGWTGGDCGTKDPAIDDGARAAYVKYVT